MDSEYNLVFRGEVAHDHDPVVTRQKLAKAFKASDEKIAALFSGKPFTLRKGVSSTDGAKLQRQLREIGAITYLELMQQKSVEPARSNLSTNNPQPFVTPSREAQKKSPRQSPTSLSLQPIEEPASVVTHQEHEEEKPAKEKIPFSFPRIELSFNFLAIFFTLLGLTCLLVFSPYPDFVLRKGFAVGGFLLFIGLRKLKA